MLGDSVDVLDDSAPVATELLVTVSIVLLIVMIVDDGISVQLTHPELISTSQIVTLVQQNTSGSKLKVLMRLSCID